MTWKDIMKENPDGTKDILQMIANLESEAFSYSLGEEDFEKVKDAFDMLREMYKDYPEEPPKRPVFGGKGRIKDIQFSDE